jgi:hypothetical protein
MRHFCGHLRNGEILPLGFVYCYEGLLVTFRRYCNWPNPTNMAVLFVSARENAELVYKFHVVLRTLNIPIKFLTSVALPVLSKFCHNASPPVRRQIRPGSQLPSIAACSGNPLPIILPSEISDSLPCFQANFTRRTIGYCLRKLRAIKKILRKNVIFHSTIHMFFFVRPLLRLLLCYFNRLSRYGSSSPCTRVSVNTRTYSLDQVHFLNVPISLEALEMGRDV